MLLPALARCARPGYMTAKKLSLMALGSIVLGGLAVRAGEFPDDWTWHDKPEYHAAHVALEGRHLFVSISLTSLFATFRKGRITVHHETAIHLE
jgi:hypothetical protein